MKKLFYRFITLVFIVLLSACGSGSKSPSASRELKAVVKPSVQALDQHVAAIQLAISVPLGVGPKLKSNGTVDVDAAIEFANSVGHVANNISFQDVTYTPAQSATVLGQIKIYVISADGFKEADEITVHLEVTDGASPSQDDFKLLSFKAWNFDGMMVFDKNATNPTTNINISPTLTTSIE